MREKTRCIICSNPIGSSGFIGTIKDMSVIFCEEHHKMCDHGCDSCTHLSRCSASKINNKLDKI